MFQITLKNNKAFQCTESETLVEGAKKANIILEHSCLSGRCSSCKVKVESGISATDQDEHPLSEDEKNEGYILSCIRKPKSDMHILAEDLSEYSIPASKTLPAKINHIEKLSPDVLKITFRFPPNQAFTFLPGQYVNIIKGPIKRSYSIANAVGEKGSIELFIKNYNGGQLSQYWFNEARVNDLLRIEGPKGTFFLRNLEEVDNLIFLATGTGIAPIRSILESMDIEKMTNLKIYLFWGVRNYEDLFWTPELVDYPIEYIPVLSRQIVPLIENGYVQNILLGKGLDLSRSAVYACGSNNMILEAKEKLTLEGLSEQNFYSDAFVSSN